MIYIKNLKEIWNNSDEKQKKIHHQSIYNILSQLTKTTNSDFEKFNIFLENVFKNTFHYIFLLIIDKTIIGMSTLLIEPKLIHGLNFIGHIEDVVIDKTFRGNGYGKYILDFLIEKSKELGCYKLILDCNTKSVSFYTKIGFKNSQNGMTYYN